MAPTASADENEAIGEEYKQIFDEHVVIIDEKWFHLCTRPLRESVQASGNGEQGHPVASSPDWRSVSSAWSLVGTWSSWEPRHRRGIKRRRDGLHTADSGIIEAMHADGWCV